MVAEHPAPAPADRAVILVVWVRYGFLAALLAVLAARVARSRGSERRHSHDLSERARGAISARASVLEASRIGGIPHACGVRPSSRVTARSRARRRRSPAAPEEVKVLRRVRAAPSVRACLELCPQGEPASPRCCPATAQARDGFSRPLCFRGPRAEIAILFAESGIRLRSSPNRSFPTTWSSLLEGLLWRWATRWRRRVAG